MNYFLLCWTNEGFECVVDVTEDHPDNRGVTDAMAMICGEEVPENRANKIAQQIRMRAQFNPQRQTEAYVIGTGFDLDTILELSVTDTQMLVDFAREKHYYKVLDTRPLTRPSVIV